MKAVFSAANLSLKAAFHRVPQKASSWPRSTIRTWHRTRVRSVWTLWNETGIRPNGHWSTFSRWSDASWLYHSLSLVLMRRLDESSWTAMTSSVSMQKCTRRSMLSPMLHSARLLPNVRKKNRRLAMKQLQRLKPTHQLRDNLRLQ